MASKQPVGQMRAFRVEKGSTEAKLDSVEIPQVGPHDVLIRVHAAILAPDVFRLVKAGRLQQAPTTLGHKVAGTLVTVGEAVDYLQPGQRVRLDPNLSCSKCLNCRTDRDQLCAECGTMGFFSLTSSPRWEQYHCGGLADYVRAPASQVDLLPDSVPFEVGAMVHDCGNAIRALKNAQLPLGSTLLITSATGAMGSLCIKMAPLFGVTRLILVSRNTDRLRESAKMATIPCECVGTDNLGENWVPEQGLGRKICELAPTGVDAIIDFSPQGVDLWQVLDGLKLAGTFVLMGGNHSVLPYSARTLGLKCWRIVGNRNHSRADSQAAITLLANGSLDVSGLFTHEYSLDDVEAAATQLQDRSQRSVMTVVRP